MASLDEEAPPEHGQDANLILPESLVPSPTHIQAHITTVGFDGLLRTPLRLKEDLAEGCGGKLWPAGMVLARYLLRIYGGSGGELLGGKKIIELGAGCGLVGLALALNNPASLTTPLYITDQTPMLSLMRENVLLNDLQDVVIPLVLDCILIAFVQADLHFMKKARKLFIVEHALDDPDRATYSRENIFLQVKTFNPFKLIFVRLL
ncbi:MAG: hypothetical protein M1840_006030 [Geoglossum simile]|nr:MAG: hypothetical protein M1840_006030 [Geoglossum simile]